MIGFAGLRLIGKAKKQNKLKKNDSEFNKPKRSGDRRDLVHKTLTFYVKTLYMSEAWYNTRTGG